MINFNEWCDNLKKYWLNKDISSIINLFDENVEYYETPFEKVKDIKTVWEDIKNNQIDDLHYKIIGTKEDTVVVNFIMKESDELIDMIYLVKLNSLGKCNYFKQWYMCSK